MMIVSDALWIGTIFVLAIIIGGVLLAINYWRTHHYHSSLTQPYECGFPPAQSPQIHTAKGFHPQYYMIGLLFLAFDLEIVILIPFALYTTSLTMIGFLSGMIFLTLLALLFVLEWKKGVLKWK
jgi:NADH-quinone oxidoreductase subunit A